MTLSTFEYGLAATAHWHVSLPITIVLIWAVLRKYYVLSKRSHPGIFVARLPGLSPQRSWIKHPAATVESAVALLPPDENFQVITASGPVIILRSQHAREASRHPNLSLAEHVRRHFFPDYPGFEGVQIGLDGHIHDTLRETLARRLTQALGALIPDLCQETTAAVNAAFGHSVEWTTVEIGPSLLDIVNRVHARVLLGRRLGRTDRWLRISKDYLICTGQSMFFLSVLPGFLRPLGHWLVPSCRKLRALVAEASDLIAGELEQRKSARDKAFHCIDEHEKPCDALTWLCEESHSRGQALNIRDLVSLQLGVAVTANHTTTEALFQAVCHLCDHPEVLPSLREEIGRVIGGTSGSTGWSKTSFHELRLLESFLSESQRHSRVTFSPTTLRRIATCDVVLASGYVVKKGAAVEVLTRNLDPEVYADPYTFDASRFLEKRARVGESASWQYVSTSPEQMGFGLGKHACPGRFFAANEMKMILGQLIIQYDWERISSHGQTNSGAQPDFTTKLRCRRRIGEIDVGKVCSV